MTNNKPKSKVKEEHNWIYPNPLGVDYPVCNKCGVVQRADGKNSPCKNHFKVTLRTKKSEEWDGLFQKQIKKIKFMLSQPDTDIKTKVESLAQVMAEDIQIAVEKALTKQREEIVKLVKDEISWERKKVDEVTHDYKYVHEQTLLNLTNLYKRIEAINLIKERGKR